VCSTKVQVKATFYAGNGEKENMGPNYQLAPFLRLCIRERQKMIGLPNQKL
jgi:hypothetical protein